MVQAISEGLGVHGSPWSARLSMSEQQLQAARYGRRGMEPEESLSGAQGASSHVHIKHLNMFEL